MDCIKPFQRKNKMGRWESFPCGQCVVCKIAKASEWAARMVHESSEFPEACFLTLTYENNEQISLDKKHVQDCFKRVRRSGVRLKYFVAGEYGSTTYRPHYHICLFYDGDLGFQPDSNLGKNNGIWRFWPHGLVNWGSFNSSSARYTADYLLKSVGQELPTFLEKPFRLISKGMGKAYAKRNLKQIEKHGVTIDGIHRPVSRYYKNMFSEEAKLDLVRKALERTEEYYVANALQREKNIIAKQTLFRPEE